MKGCLRWILILGVLLLVLLVLLVLGIRMRYGGGGPGFPDRNTEPRFPASVLETVVDLPLPPGNVAVSAQGRLFFSFHPEAGPDTKVAELVNGQIVSYPSAVFQRPRTDGPFFDTVLSLRIDRQDRLWTLDNASHGLGQPRLLAFDLATNELAHHFDFPAECAPLGSHLNDFQVDPLGTTIYIAEASIFGLNPALVVYDVEQKSCRRLLEGHVSVQADPFTPVVQGREMLVFGIFAIRPGVDSIALDTRGEWLYFGAVSAERMYRVRAADLRDPALDAGTLGSRVEAFASKTMSDGITIDGEGNLYLSDPEHSSIVRLAQDRTLQTLVRDERLRWPDGFGWGPDGWLYVTCSALHHVIGRLPSHVRARAPYQIYRFRPGPAGVPGH